MFERKGGVFYWQDNDTSQQGSFGTKHKHTALKLLHAKNEAYEQPILNLALARAYATAHGHRCTEFTRRCRSVAIEGISLHSYRHASAQRAKSAGYPQRFAQAALGHSSRAVHEAYARDAIVICPAL
jgi:integrase